MATRSETNGAQAHENPRNTGIDLIRICMTFLVILHHTAIVYGGSGGWFWREEPNASNQLLVMFNATNQSYFMGVFFLLAGYYTPLSYDRKGCRRYLGDRLIRLGIPLLAFYFVLFPFTVALAENGGGRDLLRLWGQGIIQGTYGPGPLWFAIALLIFAFAYAFWRSTGLSGANRREPAGALPSAPATLAWMIAIGLVAFAVRLVIPVGREILWLQLGYFPGYILLFLAGIAAAPRHLLERIGWRAALPWIMVAIIAVSTLPIVLTLRGAAGGFEGGWNLNAFYYAMWEPFVAVGAIMGLFAWAARSTVASRPFVGGLGSSAFGAFIIHPPVIVALSMGVASWPSAPLVKFLVVGAAASAISFALAAIMRQLPGVRRVL